jgi:membrane protease YdiL (CAAX protease family)
MTGPMFFIALLWAIAVAPFIGGVRGVATNAGWLLLPLIWLRFHPHPSLIGLGPLRPARRILLIAASALGAGVCTGFALTAVGHCFPPLVQFTLALPSLHRGVCGGSIVLFIALIPVAHFGHELFYRGYLQSRFTTLFHAAGPAILLTGVLFAWTHVFIFSSPDFRAVFARMTGAPAPSPEVILAAVTAFTFVESVAAGFIFHVSKTLLGPVAFRAANLITIVLIAYPAAGLL